MDAPNSWTDIVRDVAHDLKTPLAAAKGFVDLLENCGDPLTERQERFAQRAMKALDRMEELVGQLVDLAWIDADRSIEIALCDLTALIDDAVDLVRASAERAQVTLHAEIDPELGMIEAEERRLNRVLLNLLSNAIKYNRPDGEIWLTARSRSDNIEITVRDSGRGISPEALPHLFDRFFKERQVGQRVEGAGLGLAIVKAMIEKHGGSIQVESTPGMGSTFTFVLPRVQPSSEGRDAAREALSAPVGSAESVDFVREDNTNEVLDAVDDNIQEPVQTYSDEDEADVAEQK